MDRALFALIAVFVAVLAYVSTFEMFVTIMLGMILYEVSPYTIEQ